MKIHQGVKPALWGAAAGAVAISIIGFSVMGWTLGSTAERLAVARSESAVVAVLSPICVDKFQHSAEAATNMTELKKVSSYQQGSFIEKGGWATLPGSESPDSSVARACADVLSSAKL